MEVKLLGSSTLEQIEERIKVVAGAGKLSRFEGNVFEVLETCNDYQTNLKLIKRIIDMGHETIIEHDYLVFALSDITPIVEQTIIGNRLASFTIKSGREVDFRNAGYYIPDFRTTEGIIHPENEALKGKYVKHMKYLFSEYGYFVDNNTDVEDSRFILPYSFYTNIVMGMDARELEKLIISLLYGKLSNISELKKFGQKLMEQIENKVPYLIDKIKKHNKESKVFFDFDRYQQNSDFPIKILSNPKLLSYTEDCDTQIRITYLMGKYQCDSDKANSILQLLTHREENFSEKLMQHIINKSENRELEYINFQFQIPISLIILKHFTRHRTQSLIVPDFVPMWDLHNYTIPPTIKETNPERYHKIHAENMKVYSSFRNQGVMEDDLVYFYLCGQMCNVISNMNGRTLSWICKMRCCNKAQWQIRDIMNEIARQVREIAPVYGKFLGPSCETTGICPEGRESCGKRIKKNRLESII